MNILVQCGAERCPEGHPSPVPGSPRSGAEGRTRHTPLSAAFPPERSGGGNDKLTDEAHEAHQPA